MSRGSPLIRCVSFAPLLMHSSYAHRHPRERIGRVEAMMEGNAQWRQLDLPQPATSAVQKRRLDPMLRAELTGLLKLLINECVAALAQTKEAADE
jgi:hypothetical protein